MSASRFHWCLVTSAQAPAEDLSAPAREAGGSVVGLRGRTADNVGTAPQVAHGYIQWRS